MKMQQMKTTRHAPFCQRVSTRSIVCKAAAFAGCMAAGLSAAAINLLVVNLAHAEFRLPPIGNDPDRCDRGYVGNTIGQANAVSDKLLDLRQCSFKGADLHGRVLAGGLMSDADFSGTNMQEAVLTKAYAVKANFEGADLTNAVVDRVDFSGANLKGVKFINTVVTGAQFLGAQLDGSIWEDALIGSQDVGKLCENPTLTGESRMQVGCRVVKK
ncbi:Thylakoid lumenal 17 protein, chloroplastic [Tetrabaena socialis]|uniref:Thylakoid lumenal 17 protein, chloroplastic n=1 Tax=Tetrabaena socialis TaxID=47790 RepID=A0A2J8AA78_9CHLO|nr:Thylakoid lumenal 17 protein, chloroplastic [Tetrabaena socialis]|eukprot:PNH09429.1 Thylakoid lumenal 17 protein, chloroplastic [Tetrabaena socialis]